MSISILFKVSNIKSMGNLGWALDSSILCLSRTCDFESFMVMVLDECWWAPWCFCYSWDMTSYSITKHWRGKIFFLLWLQQILIICRDWEQRTNSWSGVWLLWWVSRLCNQVESKFNRVANWWKGSEERGEKGWCDFSWETHVLVCFNLGCKLHWWGQVEWDLCGVWWTLCLPL